MGQISTKPKYISHKRIYLKPKLDIRYECNKCIYDKKIDKWICSKCLLNENIILSKKIFPYKSKLKENYKHGVIIRNILLGIAILCFLNILNQNFN